MFETRSTFYCNNDFFCVLVRDTLRVSLHGAAHEVGIMGGIFVFSCDVLFRVLMFVFDRGNLCFLFGLA